MGSKFMFDKTRLEFRKVTRSTWEIFLKGLKYFLVTVSLAVVYYIVFSLFVDTDVEKQLAQENQAYRQVYSQMQRREALVGDVIEGLKVKDDAIYQQLFKSSVSDIRGGVLDLLLAPEDSVRDKDLVDYVGKKLGTLSGSARRIEDNFQEIMLLLQGAESSVPPMSCPLESFSYARAGASLGQRINPFYKIPVMHDGLDLVAPQGAAVIASAPGVVTGTTRSGKGKGNVVEIAHPGGYVTRYAHLDDIRVTQGQRVRLGTLIGHVGMSGNSFAPHLHYEVCRDSVRLDPVNHFFASASPEDYMEMLFMATNAGQSMD